MERKSSRPEEGGNLPSVNASYFCCSMFCMCILAPIESVKKNKKQKERSDLIQYYHIDTISVFCWCIGNGKSAVRTGCWRTGSNNTRYSHFYVIVSKLVSYVVINNLLNVNEQNQPRDLFSASIHRSRSVASSFHFIWNVWQGGYMCEAISLTSSGIM